MTDAPAARVTAASDVLGTVEAFRTDRITLPDFLNRTWGQIHGLVPPPGVDLGEEAIDAIVRLLMPMS